MKREVGQAVGIFMGVAGLVGVIVQLLTVSEGMRNVSFLVLFLALIMLGLWLIAFNTWKQLRSSRALPAIEDLDCLSAGYLASQATAEEIDWIARLEERVYTSSDAVPKHVLTEWFESNPNGFSVIRMCNGQKIGHIDLLPIKPVTLERFVSGLIVEKDIRGDSLFKPEERDQITMLYVESIIVLPPKGFTNAPAILCVLNSFARLVERVCDSGKIKNIYAIAASKSGERLLKRLGFDTVALPDSRADGHELFSADFKQLAANIAGICGTQFPDQESISKILGHKVENSIVPSR
jgi:hypothetical protein